MKSFWLAAAVLATSAYAQEQHSVVPPDGFVPNETTAIAIAVAVWGPIYGHHEIIEQQPHKAILRGGVWYVTGSLPAGFRGGVAEAEIAKADGRVLRITHGR